MLVNPRPRASLLLLAALGLAGCSSTSRSGGAGGGSGTAGASGEAGSSGAAGSSGTAGAAGSSGGAGEAGTSGGSGAAGAAGTVSSAGAAGTGAAGEAGSTSSSTWCDNQATPVGVAATDYRCLDFDGAVLYPTTEWTQAETTGSMSTDSTAYTSAPQSLRFTAEADQSATLATNLVGATAVKSLSISADFNWSGNVGVAPPWATTARLMCLGVGNSRNCLTYSHGASGGEYAIEVMGACAAAFMTTCPVAAAPTAGVWTRITMTATTNGALQLTFNGVSVVTGCSAALCTGATGLASLGYYQAESSGYSFSYDNVQVTAQR